MTIVDIDEVFFDDEDDGELIGGEERNPYYSLRHQAHIILKQNHALRLAMLRAPYHPTDNPIGFHPPPIEWLADPRCDGCKRGDHDKCWIAYCYGCVDPYHGRKPGGLGVNSSSAHDTLTRNYLSTKVQSFGRIANPHAPADYEKRAAI